MRLQAPLTHAYTPCDTAYRICAHTMPPALPCSTQRHPMLSCAFGCSCMYASLTSPPPTGLHAADLSSSAAPNQPPSTSNSGSSCASQFPGCLG
ncbi:hypothetical protein B0H10DRAFT_2142820 [Mycena sp. CBHHK59/15]|nr:hypothetical protein B0H10DRAFT_2142820 [Mycena sp. CBHHK59/15]